MYGCLGNTYFSLGDFKKSIEYQERCIKLAKEKEDKSAEGSVCGKLGNAYFSLGDFKKAIYYYERGLNITTKVKEGMSAAGRVYFNLGFSYRKLGNVKKAIFYFEHCLKIANEVGDRSAEAMVHGHLGNVYRSIGDFEKAIDYHERHLKFAKEVKDRSEEGRAYGDLGNIYQGLGDFKKAISYYESSLRIAKEVEERAQEGRAYGNLGNTYFRLGNVKKAIDYHERHLEICKTFNDKFEEGIASGNLGNDYHSLGEFKKAIDYHEHHLRMAKEVQDKLGEGKAYGNLGNAFFRLGDLKKAIDYHERRLNIAEEVVDKPGQGNACGNLGNAHFIQGKFKKAIEYYKRRLNIAKETRDHSGEGHAYGHLGNAYRELGDLEKGIYYHELQLKIAVKVGERALEGKAYGGLGAVYKKLGDVKKARDYIELELKVAKQVEDMVEVGDSYTLLGDIFESQGSSHEALKCYQSSVRAFNGIRASLQSKDEWKISLRDLHQKSYTALFRILLKLDRSDEALCAAEKGRAQALKDLMESQYGIQTLDTTSIPEDESIKDLLSTFRFNTVFPAFDNHKGVINFWVIQNGKNICRRVKETDGLSMQNDVTNFVQDLIESTFASIGVRAEVKCEDSSLNEQKKSSFAQERSDQTRTLSLQKHQLRSLYDVAIHPVADLIDGDELIIVPEGPLWLAPYAAFMDSNSKYLSESLKIRLIPSLTSFKLILDCPTNYHSKTGALLVGDPWVQEVVSAEGRKLQQLPCAKEEVEMIGRMLNTLPLTGTEATKDEVLKRLSSVALVHIAAHGRMDTGEITLCPNPSRASRVPEDKDFLLKMSDVLDVKLRARLAVLSCCHSGRGDIKAEGVVGIARAFLGAGARSVLVSLWAIDDEATLEFMKSFYQGLLKGRSTSESMNQAMKSMRQSDKFSEVKYWAPFVLIGDDITLEMVGSD